MNPPHHHDIPGSWEETEWMPANTGTYYRRIFCPYYHGLRDVLSVHQRLEELVVVGGDRRRSVCRGAGLECLCMGIRSGAGIRDNMDAEAGRKESRRIVLALFQPTACGSG